MYELLKNIDRRWIFLCMLLAVAVPILVQVRFPEKPTAMSRAVFDTIERLPAGSRVTVRFGR